MRLHDDLMMFEELTPTTMSRIEADTNKIFDFLVEPVILTKRCLIIRVGWRLKMNGDRHICIDLVCYNGYFQLFVLISIHPGPIMFGTIVIDMF